MRKFVPFITHAAILLLGLIIGGAFVAHKFIYGELPNAKKYIGQEARYIQLKDNEEAVWYEHILSEYYLGQLYLWNPLYKFNRQKGVEILGGLANRGYTPAASTLYGYYMIDAFDSLKHYEGENIINNKAHFDAAYHWARTSAEQGYNANLMAMVYFYHLDKFQDISDDLALLEKLMPKTQDPNSSKMLATAFERIGQPEKATYWLENAVKVEASPPAPPACMTITPWRGW